MDSHASIELTDEQQRVMELLAAGRNVFCTGFAGTGKSFLLAEVLTLHSMRGNTVVTASSGLAALNINGQTIHRFAGVGAAEGPVGDVVDAARGDARVVERWTDCGLLIIDVLGRIIQTMGGIITATHDSYDGSFRL